MVHRGMSESMNEIDIHVPGGRFHYLAGGPEDAPLILCLHGFPDHPPSFAPLMTRLIEAGYRVAAPWMRGYRPSVSWGPYHVDRLTLDIVELAHALSPRRPVHAIGHDWGAAALYYALADAPMRFASAVTMAVPHPLVFLRNLRRHPDQVRRSSYMLLFQLAGVADYLARRRDFALIDRLWRTWSPGLSLPEDARAALHACLRASMPAPLAYYRALLWPPREALARLRGSALARPITVPTLYLHGTRDGCIAPSLAMGQEQLFAGPFESVHIEGGGHFLQLEAPDAVAGYIVDWLQSFPSMP